MRTFLLPLMLFFALLGYLQGQTISLTFTATLNGNHQPLDSIHISNLTQGGDTMLFGSDTVLVLNHGIGVDEAVNGNSSQLILYPPSPNPSTQTAALRIFVPRDAMVTMMAHDLLGREMATLRQWLPAGHHTFAFSPGREACCLLSVEALGQRQVQRLLSLNGSGGDGRISYTGALGGLSTMRTSFAVMPWAPGDQLRFIGYSATGADTIDDNPGQSTTYTFQYASGLCPATITDINGNTYNTVQIGTQCWMKENLKVRNYKNGMAIPLVTDYSNWMNLSTGARCWNNNDSSSYAAAYGSLYNWSAVVDANGLCPAGWHVPTDLEWKILEMHLGMSQAQADSTGYRGNSEGSKLKEAGTTHWNSANTGANNSSGFTALPGGYCYTSVGSFSPVGVTGWWWTASPGSASTAWQRGLQYNIIKVSRVADDRTNGISVRCVKD